MAELRTKLSTHPSLQGGEADEAIQRGLWWDWIATRPSGARNDRKEGRKIWPHLLNFVNVRRCFGQKYASL